MLTVASLYYHHSLQELILFLAIISTVSWIAVLLTTLLRFTLQYSYHRRSKRVTTLVEEKS